MKMLVFWRAGRLTGSLMVKDLTTIFSLKYVALLLDGVSNSCRRRRCCASLYQMHDLLDLLLLVRVVGASRDRRTHPCRWCGSR